MAGGSPGKVCLTLGAVVATRIKGWRESVLPTITDRCAREMPCGDQRLVPTDCLVLFVLLDPSPSLSPPSRDHR